MTTSTVTAKAGNWLGSYLGGTFAARVFVAMTPTVSHGFGHVNQNASCTVLWIQRRSSFGRSSEVAAPTQRPVEARYAAPACASPFDRGRPPLRRRVPRQPRNASFAAAGRADTVASAAKRRFVAAYDPLARHVDRRTWSADKI